MAYSDYQELIAVARENFIAGKYSTAEPLLTQLLLTNAREPEIYQMLATIFYDQGKFNKAIKTFKRALEIDPNYTDASIGLSIILNDLGRYDEGKTIFVEAQDLLSKKKSKMDPFVQDKIAKKHLELASLYFQYFDYKEAIDQYYKALALSTKKEDIVIKIAESQVKLDHADKAIKELKKYISEYPQAIGARLKLGIIYYNANRIIEATEQWEQILARDPNHKEAKSFITMAEKAGVTELGV
ncbi:MAG: tetratricopeptide repeat protein [Bdellovibrionales bacterium]|nr:tetratricopeptide repeat protein [Bdellovibrionales bacterium]